MVYSIGQNTRLTLRGGKTGMAIHEAGEVSWADRRNLVHREEQLMDGPFEAILVELQD